MSVSLSNESMLNRALRRMGPVLCGVLIAVLASVPDGRAADAPVTTAPARVEAWSLLAAGEATAAAAQFARSEDRESRVGRGAALLAAQPRTAAGLQRSRQLLQDVVDESLQDDWEVMAEFLLARWYQLHAIETDEAEGERRLLALLERRAGHPWADAAAPKLVIAWLQPTLDDAEYARREARLDSLLERVRDAGALRDARLARADAALRRGADHGRALPHYRALVEEAEALRPTLRARVMFQAAESAAALGLHDEAAEGWRRFVAEFPNDFRAGEAKRRAEAILKP